MKVKTKFLKVISDIHTPVGVYLKLRDLYSKIFYWKALIIKVLKIVCHLFVLNPKLKFQLITIL